MPKLKPYSYVSTQGEVIVLAPSKKKAYKAITLEHEPGLSLKKEELKRVKGKKCQILEVGLNTLKAEAGETISIQEAVQVAVTNALDARFPPQPPAKYDESPGSRFVGGVHS